MGIGVTFRLGPDPDASPASPRAEDSAINQPTSSDASRAEEFTLISRERWHLSPRFDLSHAL
jgi:hypothetical protein